MSFVVEKEVLLHGRCDRVKTLVYGKPNRYIFYHGRKAATLIGDHEQRNGRRTM